MFYYLILMYQNYNFRFISAWWLKHLILRITLNERSKHKKYRNLNTYSKNVKICFSLIALNILPPFSELCVEYCWICDGGPWRDMCPSTPDTGPECPNREPVGTTKNKIYKLYQRNQHYILSDEALELLNWNSKIILE